MAAIMTSAENLKFCIFIRDWPAFLLDMRIFGKSDEQLNCDKKARIK